MKTVKVTISQYTAFNGEKTFVIDKLVNAVDVADCFVGDKISENALRNLTRATKFDVTIVEGKIGDR